ncbi:ABC transporter substrate-binding protein [Glycomyces harbinensis]|uniref:Multiple sugar transport system substrate-binding protein n=1 Tax=Glycomyces harbinensis TaxID=58114 RepID=A0A1G7DBI6_9ACTN|nr:sugar ABC transporter substrate-binding protein [Glycomyces harbinensis]SDE48917.1 multiple sugar transport system substrate-binding protein [Glycomyces harbinensis]
MTRKRTFRRTAVALTAVSATVSLAACGGLGSGTDGGGDDGDGVVTFWHYYGDPHGVPLEAMLARYTEETGVEVEPRFIPYDDFNRTLQQQAAAGDLPDVALINAFDTSQMAQAGVIEDLSAYADEWGEQDAYYETGWETGQVDGATYGIPHLADDYALYYNEEILAEAGVEVPTTWDEMEAAAAAIAESGAASYGLAMSGIEGAEGATGVLLRTLAAGGDLADFGGDPGVAALESLQRMTASGGMSEGFLTWNEDDAMASFTNGEAGMAINSASAVNVVRENAPDMTWNVAPLPADATEATYLSAENLTIGAGSGDADAAWDLIEWMQQPSVLEEYLPERNKLPARDDVPGAVTDPVRAVFADQLVNSWAPTGDLAEKSNEALTIVQQALQAVISGSAAPADAAAEAQAAIDEALGN